MWRLLHIEFQGGTDAVEYGGVQRLQESPRCTDLKRLGGHIDDWLDVLSTYGSELEHCPRMLRSMILAIIPKAYEEELLTKPECTRDYLDIIAWCRQKTQILRTRELSDFTRRPSGSSSRVTALAATAKDHSTDAQGDSLPPLKPLPEGSAP